MNEAEVQQRVGAVFARRRSAKKLSPAALAKAAGVDVKTLRAFEAGERWPQDTTRAKIESALDLAVGTADEMRSKLSSLPDGSDIERRIRDVLHRSDFAFSEPSDPGDSQTSIAAAEMVEQLRTLAAVIRQARNAAVHGGSADDHEVLVQSVVTADALITVVLQAMPDVLGPWATRNRLASPEPVLDAIPDVVVNWRGSPGDESDLPAAARRGGGKSQGQRLREQQDSDAEEAD